MSGKMNLKDNLRGGLGGGLKVESTTKRDNPLDATLPRAVPALERELQAQATAQPEHSQLVKQNMKLTLQQYEELTGFARRIQHNGQKHPERITINTVLRSLAALFDDFKSADISTIKTEEDLRQLIREQIRRGGSH
jgi:non-ribosomal peptide synthetase component F